MKRRGFYRRRSSVPFKAVCIILMLLTGVLLTDAKLRPAIYDLAAVEAHAAAVNTVHTAVEETLAKNGMSYADIVSISRNESGDITGITTDIVKLNLFKSRVTTAVDNAFTQKGTAEVSVALGSATGIIFFSGWGPYIDIKIGMKSSTHSDFENVFESAGINQTQHSVMLNMESQVILNMSGRRITRTVETSFCVAQTVIVGSVPDVMVE
ncbi:MAG: sporulation protein YunB [Ruminococcaceae bacterium]|nr:sporulation protein YunB [Oscillospiraceae bacterium]